MSRLAKAEEKIKEIQTGEILNEPKWIDKKREAVAMQTRFAEEVLASGRRREFAGRLARMKDCSTVLIFKECPECGYKKLKHANFCRDRMCPMCAWRLSLKRFAENIQLFMKMEELGYRPILVTLTIKNVPAEASELRKGVQHLLGGFKTLAKEYLAGRYVGFYRVLEVTNNKRKNEFHPHVHAVFWTDGKPLCSKQELSEKWQKALGVDYVPVNYIQSVRGQKGVKEVSKYTVKFTKPKDMPLLALADGLKGVRVVGYGGLAKKLRAEMKHSADDIEKADLVHITGEDTAEVVCPVHLIPLVKHAYTWMGRVYVG